MIDMLSALFRYVQYPNLPEFLTERMFEGKVSL